MQRHPLFIFEPMRKLILILISLIILSSCTESFYFGRINHKNKNDKKHGLWITWWDDDKTTPMSKYWYDKGKEKWKTKTYHNNGNLAVKFKERGSRLKVKYYDRFGNITHKGWARFDITEEDVHYYWHGEWKYFDEKHRLIKRVIYHEGEAKEENQIKIKADQIN